MPCNVSADGRNSASPTKPFDYGTRQPMLKRTDQETLEILNRVRVFVASASCRHDSNVSSHDWIVMTWPSSQKTFWPDWTTPPKATSPLAPCAPDFGTRWTGMQDGLILAGVQAPPAPLCLVVVKLTSPRTPHTPNSPLPRAPGRRSPLLSPTSTPPAPQTTESQSPKSVDTIPDLACREIVARSTKEPRFHHFRHPCVAI